MLFESVAHAMGAPAAGGAQPSGGEMFMQFVPLILMLVIFWFLLIRPQKKRAQEHKNMLANLKRGDYIITSGGMIGRILELQDDTALIECGESTLRITRGAIGGLHNSNAGGKASTPPPADEPKKG